MSRKKKKNLVHKGLNYYTAPSLQVLLFIIILTSIIIYNNTSIISMITLLQVIWHLTCFGADFFSLQGAMFVLPKIPSGAADKSPSRLFCPLREGKQRVAGESTVEGAPNFLCNGSIGCIYYSILCLTYYFILGKINYSSLRKDYESSRD